VAVRSDGYLFAAPHIAKASPSFVQPCISVCPPDRHRSKRRLKLLSGVADVAGSNLARGYLTLKTEVFRDFPLPLQEYLDTDLIAAYRLRH
jgi:hypothetical protein